MRIWPERRSRSRKLKTVARLNCSRRPRNPASFRGVAEICRSLACAIRRVDPTHPSTAKNLHDVGRLGYIGSSLSPCFEHKTNKSTFLNSQPLLPMTTAKRYFIGQLRRTAFSRYPSAQHRSDAVARDSVGKVQKSARGRNRGNGLLHSCHRHLHSSPVLRIPGLRPQP